MVDMAALAARYPAVAATLAEVKLTPQQLEAYRAAILGVLVYERADSVPMRDWTLPRQIDRPPAKFLGVEPTSALAQNFALSKAHPDEFNLDVAGVGP